MKDRNPKQTMRRLQSGKLKAFIGVSVTLGALWAFAHGSNMHEIKEPKTLSDETKQKLLLDEINSSYIKSVKPIFVNKCFDCHSSQTQYPWYSKLPWVNQLIIDDLKDAKKHLDVSHDFPFQGHGSPESDLDAIQEAIDKGTMPPLRYKFMHWSAKITSEDKEKIFNWIVESQRKLKSHGEEK